MRLNAAQHVLSLKIVYYGPGLSGKTTNLQQLHQGYPEDQRGRFIQLDTETERTLFFDYFPLQMGQIGGYKVKFDFFTVPGQSFYAATRRAVLQGVDGIVFVADSSPDRESANLMARDDMVAALEERGRPLARVPHVYQWNKQDVPRALSPDLMNRLLNPEGADALPAVATRGEGVWGTHERIVEAVIDSVRAAAGQRQQLQV